MVLDPCVGSGALLRPFVKAGCETTAVDVTYQGFHGTIEKNYLSMSRKELRKPDLVLINPPFNVKDENIEIPSLGGSKRPLLPEVFLNKTIEIFGKDVPILMFSPMGLRLNSRTASARRKRFLDGKYPEITCIVSLPLDVFSGILFHSEILMFSLTMPKPHYFYGEDISRKNRKRRGIPSRTLTGDK